MMKRPQMSATNNGQNEGNNDNDSTSCEVKQNGRQLYVYCDIDDQAALNFNRIIRNMSMSHRQQAISLGIEPLPIELRIQSYGGDIFSGFSMYNAISDVINSGVPVHTIVDGCCASAATFISVIGSKRMMYPRSFMLIHQLSGGMWGSYEELCDGKINIDEIMSGIKDIYFTHTNIKKEDLKGILQRDLWFTPKKCLQLGLVDTVL